MWRSEDWLVFQSELEDRDWSIANQRASAYEFIDETRQDAEKQLVR